MLMADISLLQLLPSVEALRNLLWWTDAMVETFIPACHKDPGVGWNYHTCVSTSLTKGQRGCQDGNCSSIQSKQEKNLGAIMPPLQLWLISVSWACASLKSPPAMKHDANSFLISLRHRRSTKERVVLISSKDFILVLCSVNSHKWLMDLLYPLEVP